MSRNFWDCPEIKFRTALLRINVITFEIRQNENLNKRFLIDFDLFTRGWDEISPTYKVNQKKQNSASVDERKSKQDSVRNHFPFFPA